MKLKKWIALAAGLVLWGASASAEIVLKDLGGGKVAVTFLYKDSSPEMGVIGNFDNWTTPGEAMAKNADGVWEKTIEFGATDEIVYKFYSKGSWIFDEQAPDKKDDGYGGFNGLVVVADILSGVTPMKPGAAPVAAVVRKGPPGREKVTFGTETRVVSETVLSGAEVTSSTVIGLSTWKFRGDLVPGMPGHLELTTFDGEQTLFEKGSTSWPTGLQKLAAGALFNPFYYLGGDARPALERLSFGFDTAYLNFETGTKNARLPSHQSILWQTISDENLANAGYTSYRLGPKARSWGDLSVDAALIPNKSLDGYFGLIGWANLEAYGAKVEVQYDLKSGSKTDIGQLLQDRARQDLIVGAEYYFDQFFVQGQGALAQYLPGGTYDLMPTAEKLMAEARAGVKDPAGDLELTAGWRYRGGNFDLASPRASASLMFAANDDELGAVGTQVLSLDGLVRFGYLGQASWTASLTQPVSGNPSTDLVARIKPHLRLDLAAIGTAPVAVEAVAETAYHTAPAADAPALAFEGLGLWADLATLDLWYRLDTATADLVAQTLLAEVTLAEGLRAQAGGALRLGSAATSAFGATAGLAWTLPVPELKTPVFSAQLAWNLDPYADDASGGYDLTDFGPAASAGDKTTILRLGMSWNY